MTWKEYIKFMLMFIGFFLSCIVLAGLLASLENALDMIRVCG